MAETVNYQQIGINATLQALQGQREALANENVNLKSIVSVLHAKVQDYEKQLGIGPPVNPQTSPFNPNLNGPNMPAEVVKFEEPVEDKEYHG